MKKELTIEQVQFIEKALIEKCNFKDFDDICIEVTDHISIDIEVEMNENHLSFEQAFVITMEKWNPMILPKTFSIYSKVPYIVCKRWKLLDWKYNYRIIPIAALITGITYFFNEKGFSIFLLFYPLVCVGLIANLYLIFNKQKIKIKSTLSMYALHKIFYYTFGFYSLLVINVAFLFEDPSFFAFPIYYGLIYYSLLMIGKSLVMQKHSKIENQLLKIS